MMAAIGRTTAGLAIAGYASLWGVADLNGDVTARGVFADSLAKTGAGGVRMLHQHESRAVVGVWDRMVEDERGLWVEGRIEDWSAEARYAAALTRAGALDGLSIGFRATKARRDGRLRVLSAAELWEVSLVTFPMLPGARFQARGGGGLIRRQSGEASGRSSRRPCRPGASWAWPRRAMAQDSGVWREATAGLAPRS